MIRFYKTKEQKFPNSILPLEAKKLKEAKTPADAVRESNKYLLVSLAAVLLAILIFWIRYKHVELLDIFCPFGMLFSYLCIPLHELLHAVWFPTSANTVICISWKERMAFTWSDAGVSKYRFLMLSAMPALILGVVPLILWICLPRGIFQANCASFGVISLIFCNGDFLNIKTVFKQVPKGAYVQLNEMNSYWYFPQNR